MELFLGTAGWTVPKQHAALFPSRSQGEPLSHLQHYSSLFRAVEINSSFHRPHRRSTWERWAASVPDSFRFAVKLPKAATHTAKLINTGAILLDFFNAAGGLGSKLGPVLVQLPPRLAFEEGTAHEFFTTLRELYSGPVALEPRNASWFTADVNALLQSFSISRVAAHPPKGSDLAARPAGWPRLLYWRLHGAPRTYYSAYDPAWVQAFAHQLKSAADRADTEAAWVIFDNTALGHAAENAASLSSLIQHPG